MQTSLFATENENLQGLPPLEAKQTTPQPKSKSGVRKTLYAYSIKTSRVKEPDFPYSGKQITCTSELVDFARSLQDSDIEKMLAIYLDASNQVICIQIANGTINQAVVYPREIIRLCKVKKALLQSASNGEAMEQSTMTM